jgi:3-oxoacyl-[acyl-carrier protein] reductase
MKLANKVALITGASSGIGRSIALLFAAEGARLVITADKNIKGGEETTNSIKLKGGDAIFLPTDVAKSDQVKNLVNLVDERFGRIDIVVNNAGVMLGLFPVEKLTEEIWDRHYAVNVKSIFLTAKYAVPIMRRSGGGAIVNVTSVLGQRPKPERAAYTSSKAAAILLTKALAVELAPTITVNCIIPGLVETPMMHTLTPEQRKEIITHLPIKRLGNPDEVAYAALYLVSDEARFVTGASINIDGGDSI